MSNNTPNYAAKITASLFLSQSGVAAGMIVMTTVLSIVASDLAGSPTHAGVPGAVAQFASAGSAFIWGILWDRTGRRNGLTMGLGLGVIGILIALFAVQTGTYLLLLVGMVGVGFMRSAMQLGRFIAAEVNPPSRRGRAIAWVVFSGTIGSVFGPLLIKLSIQIGTSIGLTEQAAPFAGGAVLVSLAALIAFIGLRPEPMELARLIDADDPKVSESNDPPRSLSTLLRQPPVLVAVVAMLLAQAIMVLFMSISSLNMRDLGFSIQEDIPLVITAHTLGMFALSFITGRLADRWGRVQVIASGSLLLVYGAIEAFSAVSLIDFAWALFLIGLGWNFCYVGGSALLADQLTPAERTRTQGANDLVRSFAAALGSLSSGVIYASMGWGMVGILGGSAGIIPFVLVIWWWWQRRQQPEIIG